MADWLSAPVFGDPVSALPNVVRPSAYGIVVNAEGRIAVVRAPTGNYLPGGGQWPTETPESTVIRECREEAGLVVRIGAWRRVAIEHVDAISERTHFEKRSTFCDATARVDADVPTEQDHTLIWATPTEALKTLTPGSHRWAVTEWLGDDVTTARR